MTAIPPKRPASAVTAASWTFGSIVVRTAEPASGSLRASTRPSAFSVPPGLPARRSSKVRSSPLSPTGVPSGTPRRASSSSRSGGAGPSRPAISEAIGPRSESRASPWAMTVPSRAWIAARGGIVGLALEPLAGAQAREHLLRAPGDAGRAVLVLLDGQRSVS